MGHGNGVNDRFSFILLRDQLGSLFKQKITLNIAKKSSFYHW